MQLMRLTTENYKKDWFNEPICHGLATEELKPNKLLTVVDSLLREEFPDTKNGLGYVSLEICQPDDAVTAITTNKYSTRAKTLNRKPYDISPSDLYLIRIKLTLHGEPVDDCFMYMPFVRPGGRVRLSGTMYSIAPVISDKSISPGSYSVFLRFLKDKFNVMRVNHLIKINGAYKSTQVIYAGIYKTASNNKKITRALTTLVHYLLIKYGYEGMVRRTIGHVPKPVIVNDKLKVPDGKVLVESTGIKPMKTYIGRTYTRHHIGFLVSKSEMGPVTENVLGAMLYIFDHFPDFDIRDMEDTTVWLVLLSNIVLGECDAAQMYTLMGDHMNTLDNYVNNFMAEKLKDEFQGSLGTEFYEDGFYKILMVVIQRFHIWIIVADEISASAYDKRLDITYYVLYKVIESINKLSRRLKTINPKYLNEVSLRQELGPALSLNKIFGMRAAATTDTVFDPTDNYLLSITSRAELQLHVAAVVKKKSKGPTSPNPATLLNASHAIIGTPYAVSKSKLSGMQRLNPYLPYNPKTRTIVLSEQLERDIEPLEKVLSSMERCSEKSTIPIEFALNAPRIKTHKTGE